MIKDDPVRSQWKLGNGAAAFYCATALHSLLCWWVADQKHLSPFPARVSFSISTDEVCSRRRRVCVLRQVCVHIQSLLLWLFSDCAVITCAAMCSHSNANIQCVCASLHVYSNLCTLSTFFSLAIIFKKLQFNLSSKLFTLGISFSQFHNFLASN